jgi:hypothetical protein
MPYLYNFLETIPWCRLFKTRILHYIVSTTFFLYFISLGMKNMHETWLSALHLINTKDTVLYSLTFKCVYISGNWICWLYQLSLCVKCNLKYYLLDIIVQYLVLYTLFVVAFFEILWTCKLCKCIWNVNVWMSKSNVKSFH